MISFSTLFRRRVQRHYSLALILITLAAATSRPTMAASLRSIFDVGPIYAVAVSPDSKIVASADASGVVTLWDSTSLAAVKTLPVPEFARGGNGGGPNLEPPGDPGGPGAPDAPGLPVPGNPGQPGAPGQPMGGNSEAPVAALAFSPNGKVLAVGYNDGSITFWNQESWLITNTGPVHNGVVQSLGFSPDGKWMASGADSEGADIAKLWDMSNGKVVWNIPNLKERAASLAFSPDSSLLACANADGIVTLADVSAQSVTRLTTVDTGGVNYAASVAFSPDSATLAAATYDNNIKMWDTRTKQAKKIVKGSGQESDGLTSIAFAPDGKHFAVSSGQFMAGPLELRDAETGNITEELCPQNLGGKVAFAPNGKFLVAGCLGGVDTTLSIYDLP